MDLVGRSGVGLVRPRRGPGLRLWAGYAVLGGLVIAYLVWLLVRRDQSFSVAIDGWAVDGGEVVASSLCLARAFTGPKNRDSQAVALALGASLLSWTIGDVATTVESFHGQTPAVPSVADLFYLGFYPLAYIAIVVFLRAEARGLTRSSWLDGLVAGMGAASVCATYAFHGAFLTAGGSKLTLATNLAYPVGDLLLLALIAGGTNLLPKGRRGPWALIATGMGLNVLGDTFNLLGSSFGPARLSAVLNAVAWPAAILLMSMSVWARPPIPSAGNQPHRAGFLLPGLASTAALLILFIGTMRHPGAAAIGLATATLVVVGVRLALTLLELQVVTEQRRRQAITDELTGLGNRRLLFQVMDDFFAEKEASTAPGEHRRLAFLFMDLNHFKEVNDSFGHPAGDMLLKVLGARFRASLRPVDTPVRLGGDEFAVDPHGHGRGTGRRGGTEVARLLGRAVRDRCPPRNGRRQHRHRPGPERRHAERGAVLVRGRGHVPGQAGRDLFRVLRPRPRQRRAPMAAPGGPARGAGRGPVRAALSTSARPSQWTRSALSKRS